MNSKTMEGLVGARTNMNLMNTPMRVYREARRKGDTDAMERAMGYVGDFSDKAEDYKAKADKGMEEDAKEAEEKAKAQREEAIRKRREECEKLEGETSKCRDACRLEISDEGQALLKDNMDPENTISAEKKADAVTEPVTYTKAGKTIPVEQSTSANISVSL
ncbi:MAG: hypothetical protein NC121_07620 [Blautia sp.]|nr:hypothetical protein [Blautia sp.]